MKNSIKATPLDTIFDYVYARIEVIDFTNNKFIQTATVYLLGDASKYVKTIADINTTNKPLVSAIGISTIKELTTINPNTTINPTTIIGGDEWDELDELDMEELLNTETPTISDNSKKPKVSITKDDISELVFYSRDKIGDVCNKIAVATNIKPYKQYLWIPKFHKSMSGDNISLMDHYLRSTRDIEGFPIDEHPEPAPLMDDTIKELTINNAITIMCISVDSLIQDKDKLRFIARSDAELFSLIQENSIQRFFPMMTMNVFGQYLADENEIDTKYKECAFNRNEMRNLYHSQMRILPILNKQPRVCIESSKLLTASTTNISLAYFASSSKITIDTLQLFKTMNIANMSNVAFIDMYSFDSNKIAIRLRKVQQHDQYHKDSNNSNTINNWRELLFNKAIVISILPDLRYTDLSIIINQKGFVWIHARPNAASVFSKTAFVEVISPIINTIIKQLNKYDDAFMTQSRLPLLSITDYQILNSSVSLTFKISVGYAKLIDIMISQLMNTGFITIAPNEQLRTHRTSTAFEIKYGISQLNHSELSEIEIKDVNGMVVINLLNLDIRESDLYIDIIGRLILSAKDSIALTITKKTELGLVDPVLFRPRIASDGYSRICQKKYQPILTTKDDKKAVEYVNFTFNKPAYYKCPTKNAPVLGFIQGKHEYGYCLPCCRKTKAIDFDKVHKQCIANESTEVSKSTAYKIDYPIYAISNHKIMNRVIKMPDYISKLLGRPNLVANGLILEGYDDIRDDTDDAKSYLQMAVILSALSKRPSYKALIIDIIEVIKHPTLTNNIMQCCIVARRFPTPAALAHALQERFLKNTIMSVSNRLSDIEWNDLIVFLANCMGLNILLISDDRISDLKFANMRNVDIQRPVLLVLKRLSLEWSMYHQNTRALYIPIVDTDIRTIKSISPISISSELAKVKHIAYGNIEIMLSKQFTADNIKAFVKKSNQYKLLDVLVDQKLAIIAIGRNKLISTISSAQITTLPQQITIKATATIANMITLVSDYNADLVSNIPKSKLTQYQQYLQMAIHMNSVSYELIGAESFLLKIRKFVAHDKSIIGAVIDVIDIKKIVATELMFVQSVPVKKALSEIQRAYTTHKSLRANAKSILITPLSQEFDMEYAIVNWAVNPLQINLNNKCKTDLRSALNIGFYMNDIYTIFAVDVIALWKTTRDITLESYIITKLKSIGKLPVQDTTIDTIINDITFGHYDGAILRNTIELLFRSVNSINRSIPDAIQQVKDFDALTGFDLLNLQTWPKQDIINYVKILVKQVAIKVNQYPTFDINEPSTDQRSLFYKSGKLCIHESIYNDIISFISADMVNPFRRDYIIGLQLTMSSLEDIHPHISELIYVQRIATK